MSTSPSWHIALAAALGIAACGTWQAQPLPAPVSTENPGTGWLEAGAATVDITPPPGLGLAGTGPESRRSTGYRTRLYARALFLQDPRGERIAFVVMDLAHVSANLHRLAAARLFERIGLGADRLIVSATHTHSGPAHFYGERQYNLNVSRVPGYDPHWAQFLANRIADAVESARDVKRRAVAATGSIPILGATRNRSLAPFCKNDGWQDSVVCKERLVEHALDSMLVMLRVDAVNARTADTTPLASYSVFAIHGTGVPSVNTLLDGDVHVRILRRLSRLLDPAGRLETVHILANGTEGDVAPKVDRDPACLVPRPGVVDRFPLARGPGEAVDFLEPPARKTAACLDADLEKVEAVAERVAERAAALYSQLRARLSSDLPIRRGFSSNWLPGNDSLCVAPELGSGTAAGGEGAEPRIRGWRWLFWPLLYLGFEEGGSSVQKRPGTCQSPKRGLLEPFGQIITGEHGFPEVAQLTVVRVGDAIFASVPAEVTTIAGARIRQAMVERLQGADWQPANIAIIGLANGFLQYVTTRAEYNLQHYEGGSDMYGPGTGEFLARRLADLTGLLRGGAAAPSPPAQVGPITAYPGPASEIMPLPLGPPREPNFRVILRCEAGRLAGDVYDLGPGDVFPRDSVFLRLLVEGRDGKSVATDGDGYLEVHGIGWKRGGYLWRIRWRRPPDAVSYRLERLDLDGKVLRKSDPVTCANGG